MGVRRKEKGEGETARGGVGGDVEGTYSLPLPFFRLFVICSPFRATLRHYNGTTPYGHPVYTTTSLLRPYSVEPNVKISESFHYFEDNATTSLLRPGFYGPTMVALTRFHCI